MKPLAIDLCAGLGGWTDGLLAEGWDVVGFDIERHQYGAHKYPAQLVLQDIRTIHGEQFRGKASLIVCSPPCQKYSYMSMPWKRAKALAEWYRDAQHTERIDDLNALFNACQRIGREAQCPTIIENVRGAQKWVGRAQYHYGSFYLWGDIPALMPIGVQWKAEGQNWNEWKETGKVSPHWRLQGEKPASTRLWQDTDLHANRDSHGIKQHGSGHIWYRTGNGALPSSSKRRKAASAMIAKIPLPLSTHIARTFKP